MIARNLTIEQLTDIRRRVNNGETQKSIADDYGLSALTATLHRIMGLEDAGYFDEPNVDVRTTETTVTVRFDANVGENAANVAAAVHAAVEAALQATA